MARSGRKRTLVTAEEPLAAILQKRPLSKLGTRNSSAYTFDTDWCGGKPTINQSSDYSDANLLRALSLPSRIRAAMKGRHMKISYRQLLLSLIHI